MRSERLFTTPMGERLAYCLRLNPRCIHCVLERLRNEPYWEQSKSGICIIPNCSQLSWQGVGLFCDQHYQLFVANWEMIKKERRPAIPIPPHLQDTPAALRTLQENTFTLQPCRLQTIVHALHNQGLKGPRIFCIDTEFTIQKVATEIAAVDLRSGQLIVNAVFDRRQHFEAALKLKNLQNNPHYLNPSVKHVPMVSKIPEAVQQLTDCSFNQTDILVEYSTQRTLDLSVIRQFLETNGHDSNRLLPNLTSYSCIMDIKQSFLCKEILKISRYSLSTVFAALFPGHPLTHQNHSAAVDALQLAIVIQLISQLTQPKEERQLPWFLFQGSDFRELIFDRNLRSQRRKIEAYI